MRTTRAVARLGLALGAAGLVTLAAPAPAAAQGACEVLVNGGDVARHAAVEDALVVDVSGPAELVFSGTSRTRASVEVWVEFAGVRWPMPIRTIDSPGRGGAWQTTAVPVADYAGGRRLRSIAATGGGCTTVEGWVKVVGRSPLTTVAGVTATVVPLDRADAPGLGLVRAVGARAACASTLGGVPAASARSCSPSRPGSCRSRRSGHHAWLVALGRRRRREPRARAAGRRHPRLRPPRPRPSLAAAALPHGREFPETRRAASGADHRPPRRSRRAAPRAEPDAAAAPTTAEREQRPGEGA
jgi:hypothetical protein